ncbi:MAG: hypothetical protein AAFW69_08595 [Pseudomonadota bacterium]
MPEQQTGTIDPLSAAILLGQPSVLGAACNRTAEIFDGRRRTRIRLGPVEEGRNGVLTCSGTYERVDGFPPDRLETGTEFPFEAELMEEAGGMVALRRLSFDTSVGTFVILRQR